MILYQYQRIIFLILINRAWKSVIPAIQKLLNRILNFLMIFAEESSSNIRNIIEVTFDFLDDQTKYLLKHKVVEKEKVEYSDIVLFYNGSQPFLDLYFNDYLQIGSDQFIPIIESNVNVFIIIFICIVLLPCDQSRNAKIYINRFRSFSE